MKVIISGSRGVTDYSLVVAAIMASGFEITEVVSGAADGADTLGEQWADSNGIPIKQFPADWKNIKAKDAMVKEGKYGKYNARAGFDRNEKMAKYAEACIAINLDTNGTNDMVRRAKEHGLKLYEWKPVRKASDFMYEF